MQWVTITDLMNHTKLSQIISLLEIPNSSIPISDTGSTVASINDQINYISGNTILTNLETETIDTVNAYISGYYDTSLIFSKTGDTRDSYLLKIVIDILLYELNSRLSPNTISDILVNKRNEAISTLEKISMKKFNINLPKRSDDVQSTIEVEYKANKRSNIPWN